MGKNIGKNSKATLASKLAAGAKKRFPNGKQQLQLGGVSMTVDDLTTKLQAFVDERASVIAAQATAKAKVEAERAQMPATSALITAFEAFVRLTFGNSPEALADFGLAPRKARAPMTAERKAVAVAKREATREARGTKSAKAKKSVHGNVTAKVVVTPATTPVEAPAPGPVPAAPTPAPAPSGGTTTQPKG